MNGTKKQSNDRWTQAKQDILDALDIVAEYKSLGLVVCGPEHVDDWIPCEVFGEQDRSPSAQINNSRTSQRGRYVDFRSGKSLNFFDFCAEIAKTHLTWLDALRHYADRLGIALPKKRHPGDIIEPRPWNDALAAPWFRSKPPIAQDAFLAAGGRLLKVKGDIRIALPVYGARIDEDHPIGWVIWGRLGLPISLGKSEVKMQTLPGSESGLMGLRGLSGLDRAEIVWKAEGPGDMLAIESMIPAPLRDTHFAVTNSGGAKERPKEWEVNLFRDRRVMVLADADTTGADGALRWAEAIAAVASEVRLVSLSYEQTEKNGKDVRDYFNDGHSYDELLALAENAPVVEPRINAADFDQEEIFGQIDPETGKVVLSLDRTRPTAEAFVRTFFSEDDLQTIFVRAGDFYTRSGNCYRPAEKARIENKIFDWLHGAITLKTRSIAGDDIVSKVPFPAKNTTIKAALDAVETYAYVPTEQKPPFWMGDDKPPVDDFSQVIFCKSKNLYLPTMVVFDPSPKWFNLNALNFDYDQDAWHAPYWCDFLAGLFEDDLESQDTLMEYMGLLLTPITMFQKMLFIVGPKRSGKGTIAKVIRQLAGALNCCGPTTGSLSSQFGLQPLIGKTVGIVSDARFAGNDLQTLVERLLCISGEDTLTIDRKYMESVTMQLPTRFVFLSNEVPRLADASGALASRFILLRLTKSFYGCEDLDLENKLTGELPAILNMAIRGLKTLLKRGRFVQPESAREDVEMLEELGSPIGRFVKECCKVEKGRWTSLDDLWAAWKKWCEDEEIYAIGAKATFFRNLNAAVPGIVNRKRSDYAGSRFRVYEGIELISDF